MCPFYILWWASSSSSVNHLWFQNDCDVSDHAEYSRRPTKEILVSRRLGTRLRRHVLIIGYYKCIHHLMKKKSAVLEHNPILLKRPWFIFIWLFSPLTSPHPPTSKKIIKIRQIMKDCHGWCHAKPSLLRKSSACILQVTSVQQVSLVWRCHKWACKKKSKRHRKWSFRWLSGPWAQCFNCERSVEERPILRWLDQVHKKFRTSDQSPPLIPNSVIWHWQWRIGE